MSTYFRISSISNIDGQAHTEKYASEARARETWQGHYNSAYVLTAVLVECRAGTDAIVRVVDTYTKQTGKEA